jgi:small-conductance mechanosensitive channel
MKHPDKEEVIRMLNEGESVRKVEAHLKEKYPNNKKLWLTSVTLQKFRKNHLQLDGKVLKDIQENNKLQKIKIEEEALQRQLEATNAYQDKINEIADTHLDVASKIAQLDSVIGSRIEYWYNAIAQKEELPAKADQELRKYIDQQLAILQQYKKLVEGMADKTVDYNVNVTVLNDQITVIRDVIRDVLSDFGAEKSIEFMEKLNARLEQAAYRPEKARAVDVRDLQEVKLIDEDDDGDADDQ